MAHASLFMAVASVLHVFDIGPPRDERGEPIAIRYEQTHGLLSCVHPPLVSTQDLDNSLGIVQVPGRLPMLYRTSLAGGEIPGVGCATQATGEDNLVESRLLEKKEEWAHARTLKCAVRNWQGKRGAELISVLLHVRRRNHTRSRASRVSYR